MKRLIRTGILCIVIILTACQGDNIPDSSVIHTEGTLTSETEIATQPVTQTPGIAPIQNTGISNICGTVSEPIAEEIDNPATPIELKNSTLRADWFIQPSALNMPHEVMLTPEGEIMVMANGSNQLFKISGDGSLSLFMENVSGYYGDVDGSGNVYLYESTTGTIIRIAPDGKIQTLVESQQLNTACDSGFALGEDGNFYLALNRCENQSDLFRISPQGEIELIKESAPSLPALRSNPDGNLSGVSPDGRIYEISLPDYQLLFIGKVDFPLGGIEYVSAGGLAFDGSGNLFISTCGRCNAGRVYKVGADGESEFWADVPRNGLTGIEWLSQTNEIVGSQLRIGALLAVSSNGNAREIVSGSGIVTPTAIEFSPCGELVVGNDEGGNLSIVDSQGKAAWLADFISYGPPNANITFKRDGTLYVSEAAPGFPDQILEMRVEQPIEDYADAVKPAGLIMLADGDLMVAEPTENRICIIDGITKEKTVLYDGMDFPTAIELDNDGNLYVITASPDLLWDEFWAVPVLGDQIMRVDPEGVITSLYRGDNLRSLAFGPDGYLYAAISDRIIRISPAGKVETIASGFFDGVDLTFDLGGDLFVCDRALNGVVRISGFPGGSISGKVSDESSQPVGNARVWITSQEPRLTGMVVYTDENGKFKVKAAARQYSLEISAEGFETAIIDPLAVENDQKSEVIIELRSSNPLYTLVD